MDMEQVSTTILSDPKLTSTLSSNSLSHHPPQVKSNSPPQFPSSPCYLLPTLRWIAKISVRNNLVLILPNLERNTQSLAETQTKCFKQVVSSTLPTRHLGNIQCVWGGTLNWAVQLQSVTNLFRTEQQCNKNKYYYKPFWFLLPKLTNVKSYCICLPEMGI